MKLMTFKEYLASRPRTFCAPARDFRIYITSDPSVPDFTERLSLETFLASSKSARVRMHNVIATQIWNAYATALKRDCGQLQKSTQLDAA